MHTHCNATFINEKAVQRVGKKTIIDGKVKMLLLKGQI